MSIKQAIEALEAALSDDQPYIEKSRAALAALRSMPAEPVAWLVTEKETGEKIATTRPDDWSQSMWSRQPLFATPHTEAVRMSEAEYRDAFEVAYAERCAITSRLPCSVDEVKGMRDGDHYKSEAKFLNGCWAGWVLARAVEQATAARLGVKMGDV